MDLVEIRKKAQQRSVQRPKQAQQEPNQPAELPGGLNAELDPEFVLPTEQLEEKAALQQFFPNLELATEEDYIQGISGQDKSAAVETVQWLTFMLGSEEYALSLEVILELIKPRSYTDLPKAPVYVKGILSLRGEVVPVIDLRLRLKLDPADASGYQRIIVCEGKEQSIGILVDRITQVVRVPKESIEPAPLVLSEVEKDYVGGVGRFQGRMLIQLNPDEVLKI